MKRLFVLALLLLSRVASAGDLNFMQTSDGLVSIEAEHFNANTPSDPFEWTPRNDAKASNQSVVVVESGDKAQLNKPEEYSARSPRLDYKIQFLMPGRHFIWVRARGMFVNMGLDGESNVNARRIGGFNSKTFEWRFQSRADYGHAAFVDVKTAGEHTLNLWMQSAGTSVDQIILTPDASFKPESTVAVPESPRGKLPPQAPWVSAGVDREINPPTTSVRLAGEARDYDGNVAKYEWSQIDGPSSATLVSPGSVECEATGLVSLGTYHFRLNVTDDSGLSAARVVAIKVTPAIAPVVVAPAEKILITDSAVDIQASATDADSDVKVNPLVFKWEQVSGPSPAKIKLLNLSQGSISGLVEGMYVFRVSVTDFTGNTTTADTRIIKRPVPTSAAIDADDPAIQYVGRFLTDDKKPKARESGWPATAVRARFEGTSIRARLTLAGWGSPSAFYAILDGDDEHPIVLAGDNRTDWLIAEGLSDTVHTIELVRLGGAWNSTSTFSGFYLDAGKKLVEPPARLTRRIEFYGDSITEGTLMSDQPFGNGYLAYAATTARLLKAETSVVCKSGMGLVKGFTLPQTLPGMYDRVEPMRGDKKWDFSKWTPHVVVINIGQNDSWTGTDPAAFVDAYVQFIKTIRAHYPDARILCVLGSMDAVSPGSAWPGHLTKAVERYKAETNDTKVEIFFFDFLGVKGHPNSKQARTMAEKLAGFLEAKGPELWTEPARK